MGLGCKHASLQHGARASSFYGHVEAKPLALQPGATHVLCVGQGFLLLSNRQEIQVTYELDLHPSTGSSG